MTENQNENEIVNPEVVSGEQAKLNAIVDELLEEVEESGTEAVTEEGEPFLLTQMPVVMAKGEGKVIVGDAYLHKYEDRTEIFVRLDTEDGLLAGEFLTSNMVAALSIGGVLDPDVAKNIAKLN